MLVWILKIWIREGRVPSDDTVKFISAVIQQMTSSFDSSIRIVCVSDYWFFYTHESQRSVTFYLEGSFLKFSLIQAWQVCHLKESCFFGFSVVSRQWNEVCGRNTGEGLSTASPKGCSSRSSQEKRELYLNIGSRWALSTVVAPIPDGILNVCCTTWSNVSVWTAS